MCDGVNCMDCSNELNLCKLCVKKVKVKCLCARSIGSEKICGEHVDAEHLKAEDALINDLCVPGKVSASHVEAMSLNANNLCAQQGVVNELCVNDLTVGKLNYCAKWRAAVVFAADTMYTLGSNVDWDVILDDPNGNVAIGPFSYTVPMSGYYVLNYHITSDSLSGVAVIAGVPVGLLSISVNGLPFTSFNSPYLSFATLQNGNLGTLVLLNAGDVVRMKYDVLVFDQVMGLVPYVGTVSFKGNGTFPGQSFFDIHYLSSLACSPVTCQPCPPVQVPCEPVMIHCPCNKERPEHKPEDDDCDSCQ